MKKWFDVACTKNLQDRKRNSSYVKKKCTILLLCVLAVFFYFWTHLIAARMGPPPISAFISRLEVICLFPGPTV